MFEKRMKASQKKPSALPLLVSRFDNEMGVVAQFLNSLRLASAPLSGIKQEA